ncbi:hypothetical protein [Bifidobacterium gallicum]|uniref:Thymidine phosphorylase n=1 Tax=Bifidobacterium gallicum DSM 20093 = LMG 11596 TaxID=561180 RepID=D1NVY5_9BIFI|nr:hypothetical protein [Bifidobacterium gallicum]EFA22271.1 hypothetical protein BIFGAL_04029 [Bifidobacterium gallicum DSM 20093 = LMG 11596]KFI60002.1 thymidine phosphorylase [Bifidobacterium gallicum DSM 20093 = LMG 11596]
MRSSGRSGSASIISTTAGFTHAGSPRPTRPGQLAPGLIEGIAGGVDPEQVSEIAHATAWALLSHVHETDDPQVVSRTLTLVDHEGIDLIAELWSHAEPDSLPGVLWRLYCLRTWMVRQRASLARLWRLGEPVATSASAIAGVDDAPDADGIVRTADSILAGAFTGDFPLALDRAATFIEVVSLGLRVQARRLTAAADGRDGHDGRDERDDHAGRDGHYAGQQRTQAARLLHTAANLGSTAHDLRTGARLYRRGRLE